ncbi:MAG: tRNA (guanine-N7-)-methyltransferase [Hyphomicrobiaceae bacterium]
MTQPTHAPTFGLFDSDPRITRDQWCELHSDFERLEIEIGPGDGGFLVEAANRTPKTLWMGFEARPSLVTRILERHPQPANLRVLRTDGRWVVENLIEEATVDAYHVYFPDPWWKKKHHKRRLFTPAFSAAVQRTLVPGGVIYVMTDVAPRFEEICNALRAVHLKEMEWADIERPGSSSYERKYKVQGRKFYATLFERLG